MNKDKELKNCPNCGRDMILKKGRYGAFWGCSNYSKCKGSIDTGKKKIRLEELELISVDYNCLIEIGRIDEIVEEVMENNKKVKEII
ncbi:MULTISPECIES: topoisomerase DNA-binding C4 zinc finger domain-containing protein [unclassified Clostridium]|uniref:topoisomerase DNA-binding C4 zinc finger domain-containing protein n=1 Tax=unclassified Clostridium TaxID=2614128 RepID=UPI0025BEA405|nr:MULTISPECIES: topoisomerase DNA-binding C4 zinc finger domain-containing protein [unclassified Clostridium]